MLASRGFHETINFSFIPRAHAKLFGGGDDVRQLENPIAADLDAMRPSVLPSLLAAAQRNQARGFNEMMLFEIGDLIHVTVEGRLVRDNQVFARRSGALNYIERGHHCDRDSGYRSVRVSRFECVDSGCGPGNDDVFLDAIDDRLGSEGRFLRG